ncbi:MAG: SUMF1/EgtB/PvdO family nonheme iron enzyme [Saprospiraceae bacterium]|nr:SUMF1/EgtB/PvdO family nonheme iron enzyme [Saprospiraceae bacterium]
MTFSNYYIKILLILSLIFIISCTIFKRVNETNYHQKFELPGVINISNNFSCDQTEATNLDWLEYQYWTKRIFGSKSNEYIETLTDTTVWDENNFSFKPVKTCRYWSYEELYLRHPALRKYPVVGISQKQAIEYSKWRSDRVFEVLLINLNVIEYDTAQNKDTYFTIEKYYNGEFKNIKPDERLKYYPKYRLPNLEERELILNYADSTDIAYFKKWHLSKLYRNCKEEQIPCVYSDIIPCPNDTFNSLITKPVNVGCFASKLYHLRGNVSEWTSVDEISVGGGWLDKHERIMESDTFHTTTPNAWTGFRCVCEWKVWKE